MTANTPTGQNMFNNIIGAEITKTVVVENNRTMQATDFLRRRAVNAMWGRPLFEPVGRVWPRPAAHSQPGADPSLAQAENNPLNSFREYSGIYKASIHRASRDALAGRMPGSIASFSKTVATARNHSPATPKFIRQAFSPERVKSRPLTAATGSKAANARNDRFPRLNLAYPASETRGTPAQGSAMEHQDMPSWARDFLRQDANHKRGRSSETGNALSYHKTPPGRESREAVTTARRIAPESVWTAPDYTRKTAQMTLKERPADDAARPPAYMSETEIRRMANRVYEMIEKRVSIDRRRLGL